MIAQFSEFSYGFALSYEIMNSLRPGIVGAPLFPSLGQEASVGYDVDLTPAGLPMFLQFKLANRLVASNSLQWNEYGQPYYRFSIHRRNQSQQHNLLQALAQIEPDVY